MGVDPALKEQINKEGWGGEEGGAAVYVGNKEEVDRAKEIVETEGKAENLDAYIRMRKVIEVEKGDLEQYGSVKIEPRMAWLSNWYTDGGIIFFIDASGNLAKVDLETVKINDFNKIQDGRERQAKVYDEIKRLGFIIQYHDNQSSWDWFRRQQYNKLRKAEQESNERTKKEFNF
ncbi:hypothetical protein A2Y83_01220 [Candidatus Falkowbacteria bacterium RBG_13_39_14]|uniref:Uncharacterized protein n=1 Tax=Candidatus Falkowbacteria bacterium RBG_13_39_14 TaxID=1797985 RepID=A0A1F5S505_9BACT|nr:MAG: hypothetical protein A2Y83_01220 [Candidatus Falkowbacteria bacterium RBG_13_39_14]